MLRYAQHDIDIGNMLRARAILPGTGNFVFRSCGTLREAARGMLRLRSA